ncbi:jg6289 [Pararge aegeria aegeria]|uniref:Jg6289 protein n=2 Tax=Pararge aegeria TaxID=116150 RepID=A0A8S4SH23_9NEOP|nr:jg6289 [Pararge aegeria aegeria]
MQPATLQEAINIITFLKLSHKNEIAKIKETCVKQSEVIKKLEINRTKELEYLSSELQKYELNLALRTETVKKQLTQKDEIIQKQQEIIDELNQKLKLKEDCTVPEISINIESNSDSGIAMENDDSMDKPDPVKTEPKTTRKYSRRFADPISFLRRVDFSPMKYKPSNREGAKKKEEKKKNLEVPCTEKRVLVRQFSNEKVTSDDDRVFEDTVFSDDTTETVLLRPTKKMNDSMNNHFSDDGSEDTSEEIFDRVMTRSSIRRSVKANPKYKKINRTKSKLLEQVKVNIVD